MELTLPNNWAVRPYQKAVWDFFNFQDGKRAAVAWHRRAGKDEVALHLTAVMSQERPGNYWHMLPEASQARKAIWEAVNPHTGIRRIDEAFPHAMRKTTRNNEMFIEFRNGSSWQVVGSDNFHSLVGAPPIGLVFSEYSRANPSAWAYLRPILRENGGWAFFISTYYGRNHHWKLVQNAQLWEDWFGEVLSANETGVFTPEELAAERLEYLAEFGTEEGEALYRQEYLSDAMASVQGAYFGAEISKAEKDGRITKVPYDRSALVYTGWDLGLDDETAIWFIQSVGLEPRVIDYVSGRNEDLAHYASELVKKGYEYGGHYLPHDGDAKTILSKDNAKTQLEKAGLGNVNITRRAQNSDILLADINAGRNLITKAVFDAEKCERGLDALRSYRREWDDKLKTYKRTPLHDWASHGADAWRAIAVNIAATAPKKKERRERKRRNAWAA